MELAEFLSVRAVVSTAPLSVTVSSPVGSRSPLDAFRESSVMPLLALRRPPVTVVCARLFQAWFRTTEPSVTLKMPKYLSSEELRRSVPAPFLVRVENWGSCLLVFGSALAMESISSVAPSLPRVSVLPSSISKVPKDARSRKRKPPRV